jgi:hypothetical protein
MVLSDIKALDNSMMLVYTEVTTSVGVLDEGMRRGCDAHNDAAPAVA